MKMMFPSSMVITSSNVPNTQYADWNGATAYVIGNHCYLPSNRGEYIALSNNTNKSPDTNPTDWKFIGTANRFKMFDQYLNTQTVNPTIEVDIVAYGIDGVYLGNLDAITVSIEVVDNSTMDIIESAEYILYRDLLDWQDYFFGAWVDEKTDQILFERTTLAQDISLLISINNGSNDAKCGIFFTGKTKTVGNTLFEAKIGALDYSTVVTDTASGSTYLQRGNYAKKIDLDIFANTGSANAIFKALVSARGIPIVFIGGGYEVLNVYGYVQRFEEIIKTPVQTAISVEVLGLI